MYDKKDVLKINLSQVAQALGLALEEKGTYYLCNCPFHDDKRSSFVIYDNVEKDKCGVWSCFTCGIGGDSIDLVRRIKKLTFSDSVDWIGETFELEKKALTPEQILLYKQKAEILPVLVEANEWFYEQRGDWFFEYLEKRGFTADTARQFEFGYAPNNVIELKKHLFDKGFSEEQLVGSGLFVNRASGIEPIYYGRLMIPLKDKTGNIVGFAGRAQSEYEKSKYITTTAVFAKKRKLVYGLDYIRKRDHVYSVLITEGNLDVPKLIQNYENFVNPVSVMGASITKQHIKEIVSVLPDVNKIVLALDGDVAGRGAMDKFIEKVFTADDFYYKKFIDFYILSLPEGKDLDNLGDELSLKEFRQFERTAVSIVDYLIEKLRNDYDINDTTKNNQYVSRCLKLIASLDECMFKEYVEKLAEKSGYSVDRLKQELYIYRVHQRNAVTPIYERKVLKYLTDNPDMVTEFEKEIGVPIEKLLSPAGVKVARGQFNKYFTKLKFMTAQIEKEVTRDEAVFFGLLLLANMYNEIITEYEVLDRDTKLKLNQKTNNKINEISKAYKETGRNILRRIQ